MDTNHQIIFSSVLHQQPISGIFEGLLIRLKNLSNGTYLTLCRHNKIPHLEWYRNKHKSIGHKPNSVLDLIDGKAVAINFNMFAIFFDDETNVKQPIKFKAENQKQRDKWISSINSVRIASRQLDETEPTTSNIQHNNEENGYCRIIPEPIINEESSNTNDMPCTVQSYSSFSTSSCPNRESGIGLSTSNSDESNFRLSKELTTGSVVSSSSITSPFTQSRARSSTMTHFQFVAPQTDSNTSTLTSKSSSILRTSSSSKDNRSYNSPVVKRVSTRKSCMNTPVIGLNSPRRMNSTDKRNSVTFECDENESDNEVYADNYYHCKNVANVHEYYSLPNSPRSNDINKSPLKEPQRLSLAMSICTDLKLVKFDNRFWIVGWEDRIHKAVSKSLHFGDEIITVNGNPVSFVNDINTLFYASPVGIPIQFLIRSYPHGILKTLKKSIHISQKIGIVLYEKKNKILAIEPGSLASSGKLPTEVQSFADPLKSVMPTITEINNKPLNPFSVNEEPYTRIGEIPNGQQFDVIIHPSDFIALLKAEMKSCGYV